MGRRYCPSGVWAGTIKALATQPFVGRAGLEWTYKESIWMPTAQLWRI